MKKTILLSVIMVAAVAFTFTSCNKYDEGSNFSILPAKARLVNTWKVDKVTYTTGGFSTTGTADMTLDIKKDETYSSTLTSGSTTFTETGSWSFNSDKTELSLTNSNGDVATSTIIKLKNKELSLESTSNNVTTRIDYVQK